MRRDLKDCIIIGGGPAGLTAALYLARYLRNVTVIDAQEGRGRLIPKTHNLSPFPQGISGLVLLDRMRSHAELYGATLETGTVSSVKKHGDGFQITTDRGTETARTVIFACGVFNHRPPLSRADHEQGLARGLIRYCPVCDAFEVRDKRIAVLGNDAHGFEEASFIRPYSASVTLIPPDGSPVVARSGIRVLDAPIKSLAISESEAMVTLQNGTIAHFDTLYVALGTTPQSALAAQLGVNLSATGHIATDARQRTNIEGAYAIGDITDGLDQIAVAMGQGAVAATAVHNDLMSAG